MKLKHLKLLSSFTFKFNLRRYTTGVFSTVGTTGVRGNNKYRGSAAVGRGLHSSTFQLNLSLF